MIRNKYGYLLATVATVAVASSAFALEKTGDIPSVDRGSVDVTCGPSAGPRALGHANWNFVGPQGTELFYNVDLKIGAVGVGQPVRADLSQVPKKGGSFCSVVIDQVPGSPQPTSESCVVATGFSAKKYIVTCRSS